MPQIDKEVRKEYNRQSYLKRKAKLAAKQEPVVVALEQPLPKGVEEPVVGIDYKIKLSTVIDELKNIIQKYNNDPRYEPKILFADETAKCKRYHHCRSSTDIAYVTKYFKEPNRCRREFDDYVKSVEVQLAKDHLERMNTEYELSDVIQLCGKKKIHKKGLFNVKYIMRRYPRNLVANYEYRGIDFKRLKHINEKGVATIRGETKINDRYNQTYTLDEVKKMCYKNGFKKEKGEKYLYQDYKKWLFDNLYYK